MLNLYTDRNPNRYSYKMYVDQGISWELIINIRKPMEVLINLIQKGRKMQTFDKIKYNF